MRIGWTVITSDSVSTRTSALTRLPEWKTFDESAKSHSSLHSPPPSPSRPSSPHTSLTDNSPESCTKNTLPPFPSSKSSSTLPSPSSSRGTPRACTKRQGPVRSRTLQVSRRRMRLLRIPRSTSGPMRWTWPVQSRSLQSTSPTMVLSLLKKKKEIEKKRRRD